MQGLSRRDVLKASAMVAGAAAAGGFACVEIANAQPIQVPPGLGDEIEPHTRLVMPPLIIPEFAGPAARPRRMIGAA